MNVNANMNVVVLSGDQDNSLLVTNALVQLGVNNITHIDNALDAISWLSEQHTDFLICDLKIKFISGWLLLKELKSSQKISNLPIVMVGKTAAPIEEEILKAFGIYKYLKLPEKSSDLGAVMKAACNAFSVGEQVHSFEKSAGAEKKSSGVQDHAEEVVSATTFKSADDSVLGQLECMKALLRDQQYDAAKSIAVKLLAEAPDEFNYNAVVSLLFGHNQYQLADDLCSIAVNDKQYSAPVFYYCQAKYQYQQKEYNACFALIEKSEELFGLNAETSILRGACLRKMFDFESALFSYEEALEYAPDDYRAYFNLAMCSMEMHRVPEAIGYLESLLRINPEFERAQAALKDIKAKTKKA